MTPVLAVDWGRKRLGLAVSDPSGTVARPLPTIVLETGMQAAEMVATAAADAEAQIILLGLPMNMDGTEGPSAGAARKLGRALEAKGYPVVFRDERLTSQEAMDHLRRQGEKRPPKERVDQVSALLLLQDYLNHQAEEEGRA